MRCRRSPARNARIKQKSRFNRRSTTGNKLFLDFVLSHYVSEGVQELDREKLTPLLKLKYRNAISDAITDVGRPEDVEHRF